LRTLFFPPVLTWSFLRQLPQQICSQFAKNGYKVYFCNNTLGDNSINEVEPNVLVFNNYNYALEYIRKNKITIDVFLNTWAKNHDWVEKINAKVNVYFSCDSFDDWKPYEKSMLTKSDIVLCTSEFIKKIRENDHNNVHLVRNAGDSSLVNSEYKTIEEINKVPGFKFGFVGALGRWVSTYLIKKVADKYPTFLIGRDFGKPCPSNVINLGVVNHDQLIHYYNSLDAFLLPFNTKSEITLAANPVKLYEYMMIGKPIVSTSWDETEQFNQYEKIVFTSKTDEEFMQNVDYVANMSKFDKDLLKEKCRIWMLSNRWEDRFQQIENIISDYCNKKGIKL
jgi:teichuronic acid biosynthesis glycosyltransferase TuaH